MAYSAWLRVCCTLLCVEACSGGNSARTPNANAANPAAHAAAPESSPPAPAFAHGPPDSTLFRHVAPTSPVLADLRRISPLLARDTTFFYSAEFSANWVYRGVPIDTIYYPMFQAHYGDLKQLAWSPPAVFAAGRVTLDSAHEGFVVRGSGMYSSSALDLWVYDRNVERITQVVRLAEAYGDAGDETVDVSWLLGLASPRPIALVGREAWASMDSDTLLKDSIWLRPWSGERFGPPVPVRDKSLDAYLREARWLKQK